MNFRKMSGWARLAAMCALTAAASGAAQAANWNGWARCHLQITHGASYSSAETHTWMISNVTSNLATMPGSGNWSVAGSGHLDRGDQVTSEHVEWAISGASSGARYIVQLTNGIARIRPVHAQLTQYQGITGFSQQTIAGQGPRTPSIIAATQWELGFPVVEGPAAGGTIQGSAPMTLTGPWGYQQAYGSTVNGNCEWIFLDGAVPPPPPVVTAPSTPTAPGQTPPGVPPLVVSPARSPWVGYILCEVHADAGAAYQETQTIRWELLGGIPAPAPAPGGYLHPVRWTVEGNGRSTSRLDQREWTVKVDAQSMRMMSIRTSDGQLIIEPAQPPRVAMGAVQGNRQSIGRRAPPRPFALDLAEFPMPPIVDDPGSLPIVGKIKVPLASILSPMTPAGATGSAQCQWMLSPAGRAP